jgi:hypothetical protein
MLPPAIVVAPQMKVAMIPAITIGQKINKGKAMRNSRLRRKPPVPRRARSILPKKPAIRKKAVIRKMCAMNEKVPSISLGASRTTQICGPGRKLSEAWKATPRSSAPARTPSRACSRSGESPRGIWAMFVSGRRGNRRPRHEVYAN